MHDGHNEMLSQTFHINVSPVTATNDISFSSTRPMLGNDPSRRATSDSVVPMVGGAANRFETDMLEILQYFNPFFFPVSHLPKHNPQPLLKQALLHKMRK